jgi:hypothetical protein
MSNRFKNLFFLIIGFFIAALAPTYAAETVTYYAFVTQNINGQWEVAKPVEPANLAVGSYRFQIVRFFSQTDDTYKAWVIALRGEFEFFADPNGGVKINKKYALDESQQVDSQSNNNNFSVWKDDIDNSWEKARKQWVQPLITEMEKTFSGTFNPSFMRFLIKKGIKESWNQEGTNYSLYRLHYLDAEKINNNDKKAFSRFINPTVKATIDTELLKKWVNSQESFALAKYLGIADEKHKEFYNQFKTWFNQLFPETTQEVNDDSGGEIAWQTLLSRTLYILLSLIIITLIIIAAWLFTQVNEIRQRENNYVSKDRFDSLWKQLQKIYDAQDKQRFQTVEALEKDAVFKKAVQAEINNAFMAHLNTYFNERLNEILNNKFEYAKQSAYVSKDDFDSLRAQVRKLYNILDKQSIQTAELLEKDFVRFFNKNLWLFDKNISRLSQNAVFKKVIQAEINASMAHLNTYFNEKLNEIVDEKFENLTKQYNRLENIIKQYEENLKKESSTQLEEKHVQVKQVDVNQKVQQSNDVTDKIKILLSSINSVDKVALNTLEVTVEPCLFIVNVISNDIILNFSITDYQRLDEKIQTLTDGFVKLIIPTIGADILHTEHKIVHQQSITKGKLNAVVALIRPGVKCDSIVKRKAEIIQSI